MELRNQNILFFTRSTQHGGTENVVLQLCEIFAPHVNSITVASAEGLSQDKLDTYGAKYYYVPDIENKSIKNIVSVSKLLKKIVEDEHITVIHTHHRMAAFYVRLLGLYKCCRFINTSHNTFCNKRALTRFAYMKAHLISCGEMVKKNLSEVYGLNNVTVIHNAVKQFDEEIVIDAELSKGRKDGKYLIGNIGRLSEQKGMEYYIQAVPKVISKHSNVQFYIVGSGEDEAKLKKMAEGLPIKFLGYRTDIRNVMSQLDLIVLSSLWEGLPLTPIEAFSVGKTIVATGVDGTLEIVKDKKNGLLVKAKDAEDLSNGIEWMIEHPEEQKSMELKAKETFQTEFSFDILAESYLDYYRSL